MNIKRTAKCVSAAGVVVFIALQFIGPKVTNPPVTAEIATTPEIAAILKTSCFDCHSNETKLLWFDRIAPASWLVAEDVRAARARLNFSEIGKLPPATQRAALFESINQARLGAMPPGKYLALHPSARVDGAALDVWKRNLLPPETRMAVIEIPVATTKVADVKPAPNGMNFPADFIDWGFVSATSRLDNHTARLILGNEITMRAIAAKQIRPWPDGAAFVKIAWDAASADPEHPKLVQIETMKKDSRAHAATEGWGFARWKGDALVPYGKDASFVDECTGCHAPMHDDDFVYTMPLGRGERSDAWNAEAILPAEISSAQKVPRVEAATFDLNADTIAVTFQNDAAMTRTLWNTQDDRHWFGARIPGAARTSH